LDGRVGSPLAIVYYACPGSCNDRARNHSIIWKQERPVKPVTRLIFKAFASIVAASLATGAISGAQAGPWVQPRGGHFAKFSASYLYTTTERNTNGDVVPILDSNPLVQSAAYREIMLSTYVEYGWRDRVTLVGSVPYKIATSRRTEIASDVSLVRDVDITNAGWSDLVIAARGALGRGRYPTAIEAGVKIPLGYSSAPDNGGPALGTGKADFEAALLAGFGASHVYASARAAYRIRGGSLDDEVGFSAQAGGSRGRWFTQALVEGWYTTGPIEPLDVSSTLEVPNQDALKLIATLGARIATNTSLVAEIYHVLDGRNTPTGTTIALGLVLQSR